MLKYDLDDLGYQYRGAASTKLDKMEIGPWTIIDIPQHVDNVEQEVKTFLDKIVAVEIPTSLKCNLRCKYCYISDPRMKNKEVSKEIVTKILEEFSKKFPKWIDNKDKVFISPWGAEPFMNIDTLEACYEFLHEKYGKDKYVLGTSTNGTIWSKRTSEWFTNLINDNALRDIQISLDGPPEVHDRYRPLAGGKPTFKLIESFSKNFFDLMKELGVKEKKHHFCSTIHLLDPEFPNMWTKAAEFFSEPNQWYTSLPNLPMRMSGEDLYSVREIERFIEAQKLILEVIRKRAKEGINVIDFYTSKLFMDIQCRTKNAFPFCSAMNSQLGIDVDGSIYPCHGPITTPEYKPYLWIGNLFDGVISYSKLKRNLYYQYGSIWNRAKCVSCPIYHYSSGSICWSCPPHNLAVTGEPSIDNVLKCIAYTESFPYWIEIAKINGINNKILEELPKEYNIRPKDINKNSLKIDYSKFNHYDRNYDGIIDKAVNKVCGKDLDTRDLFYTDKWWKFDNFLKEAE
ncbi:4Fe-4S cluster-binding domain-containing protein [Patescibacteria group bacterium]|nr:4Fe-4S cluster-binding domain-containing protein [Patescibacteria group bacterium]